MVEMGIILTDDNFDAIFDAIETGATIEEITTIADEVVLYEIEETEKTTYTHSVTVKERKTSNTDGSTQKGPAYINKPIELKKPLMSDCATSEELKSGYFYTTYFCENETIAKETYQELMDIKMSEVSSFLDDNYEIIGECPSYLRNRYARLSLYGV